MEKQIIENVEILDAGSEGKAIARVKERVIFVPFVVPGDVVDLVITKKRRNYLEGKAIRFHKYSDKRQEPFCEHFGVCGGCRWQNIRYEDQLYYKQKQVTDNIERIGKIIDPVILPILPSANSTFYRNKLEFTFSNRRWMVGGKTDEGQQQEDFNALGFHLPTMFDRVLDINKCWLQPDPSNEIRLEIKRYAQENHLSFYDVRNWTGFLRNIIIRSTENGGLMVIVVFRTEEREEIDLLLDNVQNKFPQITSLYYVINDKKNDIINDLPARLFSGQGFITEKMLSFNGDKTLEFRIGPYSFFQTNSKQAAVLYKTAAGFAGFHGNETVYDLYSGIGTIASFIASSVGEVIGIESVPSAVEDAIMNAKMNNISNTRFFSGEAEKLLTTGFFETHGHPDMIITDPPRSGMHEKVVKAILDAAPGKVIYISCNPATQARDLNLMKDAYELVKCQPVDMFPHTQHVENIALLHKID
jgi:23S rRNA (uracil1939-C5)-methyltransferase